MNNDLNSMIIGVLGLLAWLFLRHYITKTDKSIKKLDDNNEKLNGSLSNKIINSEKNVKSLINRNYLEITENKKDIKKLISTSSATKLESIEEFFKTTIDSIKNDIKNISISSSSVIKKQNELTKKFDEETNIITIKKRLKSHEDALTFIIEKIKKGD